MAQWYQKSVELLASYHMEIPGGYTEAGAVHRRFPVVQPSAADPTSIKTDEVGESG